MFAGRTRISDEKLRTDPSSMSVRSSSSPNVLSSMSGGMLVCGFSGARVPLVEVAPDVALADLRGSLINFNLLDLQEVKETFNGCFMLLFYPSLRVTSSCLTSPLLSFSFLLSAIFFIVGTRCFRLRHHLERKIRRDGRNKIGIFSL